MEIKQELLTKGFTPTQLKLVAAKELFENLKAEADALEKYTKLLVLDVLDDADADKIREIMGDEKNHALMLQAMVLKYDGKVKAALDDAEKAISQIRQGIAA